jgi:hypothetical protein
MTGQAPEETRVDSAQSGIVAETLDVNRPNPDEKRILQDTNTTISGQTQEKCGQKSRLSKLDWLLIRFCVVEEGISAPSVASDYGITPDAIRRRKKAENWNGEFEKSQTPTMEELLVMRNEREIARILRSMEVKLAKAAAAPGEDAKKPVAQPSDAEIGQRARAVQSLTCAADTAAATKRKIKAHEGVTPALKGNRKALADRLDRIAAKLASTALPGDAE